VHRNVLAIVVVTVLMSAASVEAAEGTDSLVSGTSHGVTGSGPLAMAAARETRQFTSLIRTVSQTPAQQPAGKRRWQARHPVLLGTILGGAGGATLAAAGVGGGDPEWRAMGVILYSALGSGFGALTGVIVKGVAGL
jgi:hypothetical protein